MTRNTHHHDEIDEYISILIQACFPWSGGEITGVLRAPIAALALTLTGAAFLHSMVDLTANPAFLAAAPAALPMLVIAVGDVVLTNGGVFFSPVDAAFLAAAPVIAVGAEISVRVGFGDVRQSRRSPRTQSQTQTQTQTQSQTQSRSETTTTTSPATRSETGSDDGVTLRVFRVADGVAVAGDTYEVKETIKELRGTGRAEWVEWDFTRERWVFTSAGITVEGIADDLSRALPDAVVVSGDGAGAGDARQDFDAMEPSRYA
ncbi:hypothetical protein [Halorubrum halodurans]|uniref:Uncharacterized protein n=1 Tax=Halorubrum halodurans TaxID=1383851 RepID=A0A256IJQ6_9EURY|nr:hypothetical protein [Halorubrum halodurans]OYR56673.1 hypothetical protein DJ70_08125 [Halorubrum halodurans]